MDTISITDHHRTTPGEQARRSVAHSQNRRVDSRGSRILVAAAVVLCGVAFGGAGASADSVEGEIEAWEPPTGPSITVPEYKMPTVQDYVGEGPLGAEKLPEGYEFPDDDADPELLVEAEEPDHGPGRFEVEVDVSPLDPRDIDGLIGEKLPEGGVIPDDDQGTPDDDADCHDSDFAERYPEKCPDDEPGTTTTVPEPTTTVAEVEPEPQVEQATAEPEYEELAFTGSNVALPLIGAGLLGTGAIVAGLSMASRRRSDVQGEA